MKILILGSNGFLGKAIYNALAESHEAFGASKTLVSDEKNFQLDLTDKTAIIAILNRLKPEVIINSAGVVENGPAAKLNPTLTRNVLEAILVTDLKLKRIIISGSAAEYGLVDADNIPVDEDTPLRPTSPYGLSKVEETSLALKHRDEYKLPIVIARIFNPIGSGMNRRFIIPGTIRQVDDIKKGKRKTIEVSRRDSRRDYIDVKDIAAAVKAIVEGNPMQAVYNVGSGVSMSNEELIDLIIKNSNLSFKPKIIETVAEQEPLIAIQADITRINKEFGWKPECTIEDTIKEIMHDAR